MEKDSAAGGARSAPTRVATDRRARHADGFPDLPNRAGQRGNDTSGGHPSGHGRPRRLSGAAHPDAPAVTAVVWEVVPAAQVWATSSDRSGSSAMAETMRVRTHRPTGEAAPVRFRRCAGALLLSLLVTGCSRLPSGRPETVRIVVEVSQPTVPGIISAGTVSVDYAPIAERLYTIAGSLPPLPKPAPVCPTDSGPWYKLTFVQDGRKLATIGADPGGCETVTLPDGTYLYARNAAGRAFFHLLRRALALYAPQLVRG